MNRKRARRFAKQLLMILGVSLMISGLLGLSVPQASATPEVAQVGAVDMSQALASANAFQQASAEEEPPPPDCTPEIEAEPNGDCIISASASSSDKVTAAAESVNGISISSDVTVLAKVRAKGTPQAQQTRCARLPRAMTLRTSYRTIFGEAWHNKRYPAGKKFCRVDGWMRDPLCHNKVMWKPPANHPPATPLIRGKVKLVDRLRIVAKAVDKVTGTAESKAKAWCRTLWNSAYAEATATASFFARAESKAWARTLVRAKAKAKGRVQELVLELNLHSQMRLKARTEARGRAATDAKADVQCSGQPPGGENKPPTCELVQFPEHVFASRPGQVPNRYRFKVVWNDADEQLAQDDAVVTVTGQAFIVKGNPDFPERWDLEGTQWVYTGWLEARQQPGEATFSVLVTDSEGATCQASKTFPVVADQF
jgi:hypothetical protein